MKDRSINCQISDISGHLVKFTSIRSLYNFFKNESKFWKNHRDKLSERNINSVYASFSHQFDSANSVIDGWAEGIELWDDATINQQVNQLIASHLGSSTAYWIWSGQPFLEAFLECLTNHGDNTATAFLDYVVRNNSGSPGSIDHFRGYLYGYEYQSQDSSIPKRRAGEKKSLNHLRSEFSDARDMLFSETSSLKSEFIEWSDSNRKGLKLRFRAQKRLIKSLHKKQEKEGKEKLNKHDHDFDEKLREWNTSIATLENTYEEKLRLDKPAQYWNKAAIRYSKQGWAWVTAIVLLVIVALINFQDFFVHWLSGKELELKLNSFQGIVLFGSIVATYAFVLRIFSRLAFSSFHLMRDAQEREQLTYLYLSLTNEAAIDKESRDIVLQALFSRSETGLLAQEHGPTMPGLDALKNSLTK